MSLDSEFVVVGRIAQQPILRFKSSESNMQEVDDSSMSGSSSSSISGRGINDHRARSVDKTSNTGLDLFDLGPANPEAMHTLTFSVKQRNIDKLPELIKEVSFGTQTRLHYTREEVAALTANPEASAAVMSFLDSANKDGSIAIDAGPYGEHIAATAPVHVWSKLLKTDFRKVQVTPITTSSSSSASSEQDPSLRPKTFIRAMQYSLPSNLVSQLEDVHGTVQIPVPRKQFGKVVKKLTKEEIREYEEFTNSNDYSVLSSNSFLRAASNVQEIRAKSADHDIKDTGAGSTRNRKRLQSTQMTPAKLLTTYNIGSSYQASNNVSQVILSMLDLTLSEGDLTLFQNNIVGGGYSESVDAWYRQPGVDFTQDRETQICQTGQDCTEPNLDMQYIMSTAKYAVNSHHYFDDVFNWAIYMNTLSDSDIPKVGSISYGYLEDQLKSLYVSYLNSFNTEAMKLALRGVTILAASGDDGVANFQARDDPSLCGYNPSFPASNPYVTAVGGTQGPELSTPSTEVAAECSVSGITTGGGFSEYWDMPDWQRTEVETYLAGTQGQAAATGYGMSSSSGRGYPDISLGANSYVVYVGGNTYLVSGTSASSPVMAGLITLVNQHRVSNGGTTLGFVNPSLYLNASQYARDVTGGHNKCTAATGCNNCCAAGFNTDTGWDPVTGVGSLDFAQFFLVFTGVEMVTNIVIPEEDDGNTIAIPVNTIIWVVLVIVPVVCGIYFLYKIITQRQAAQTSAPNVVNVDQELAPVPQTTISYSQPVANHHSNTQPQQQVFVPVVYGRVV